MPENVVSRSRTATGWLSNVSGMSVKAMFAPTPAGELDGRIVTSPGVPSSDVMSASDRKIAIPARSPGLGGATRSSVTGAENDSSLNPDAVAVPLAI